MKYLTFRSTTLLFLLVFFTGSLYAQERFNKKPPGRQDIRNPQGIKQAPLKPRPPLVLSEEEQNKVIEFFTAIDPDIAEQLNRLKHNAPAVYIERMQELYRNMHFLERLKKEDPDRYKQAVELRKLEAKSHQLARQYQESESENEKETIKKELRTVLDRLFDLKELEKEEEIKRIQNDLERLQKGVAERRANKQQIVKLHLEHLTGKAHLYKW
jgi:hypothetical protein